MDEEPNSEALELANREVKTGDIFAAQKIIADISSGIYRSPQPLSKS